MKTRLRYVQRFTDRHGVLRHYYRRKDVRVPLPDPAEDMAAFLAAYAAAAEQSSVARTRAEIPGTLGALMVDFEGSAEFGSLKPNSRDTYRAGLNLLRERPARLVPVKRITRRSVAILRDDIARKTPGMANLVLKVLKRLMAYAVEMEYRTDNPLLRLKSVKGGTHRSWTDEEMAAFEGRWARGTLPRLVYELALGTGQRRGDIAKMRWADIEGNVVHVVQEKTGTKVWVPAHRSLRQELDLAPKRGLPILITARGKGFRPDYLGEVFAQAIEDAGLPEACVLHGLRKAAARRLAEVGCTDEEIMAITGHTTREMVSLYTKDADKRRLAKAAVLKLERGGQGT